MKYLSAYLLCQIGGKESPSEKDVTAVLKSVGIEVDAKKVTSVVAELKGKSVADLIAAGSAKLASMPSGGGSAPAAASGGSPKKAAAKEVVVEEESEEEEMGMDLFD